MEEKIAALLKSINGKNNVTDYDLNLFDNDMLDSLGIAQLIASLEDTFEVDIDPEDIIPENFSTINEIASLVSRAKV